MKQVRQALVRWTAKVLPSAKTHAPVRDLADLQPLDTDQLRQVAGGTVDTTQSPRGTW